LRQFEGKF
jgi:hypothetical protein